MVCSVGECGGVGVRSRRGKQERLGGWVGEEQVVQLGELLLSSCYLITYMYECKSRIVVLLAGFERPPRSQRAMRNVPLRRRVVVRLLWLRQFLRRTLADG